MQQFFVSTNPSLLSNWLEAFPDNVALLPTSVKSGLSGPVIYWLDWNSMTEQQALAVLHALVDSSANVVVMSNKPNAEEAMQHFTHGARGYCHTHAAASQMREIALVIEHGGIWLGAEAMKRLLHGTLPLLGMAENINHSNKLEDTLDKLTGKERAVARELARGASNREIAETLSVSERTVKAHLSAIFDKCQVRDRVQLALLLNNIPLR